MTPPTIVYVTPRPPYPLTSGMAIRQFHLLKAYAEWGRVHLVTFCKDDPELENSRKLEAYCDRVHAVSTRTTLGDAWLRRPSSPRIQAQRLLTLWPSMITLSRSQEMAAIIDQLSSTADVVHVARLHMVAQVEGLLARRRSRPRMVLDLDDVEASLRFRRLRHGPRLTPAHRMFAYYDMARLWAYQARAVRRFDRVFVCSDRDRRRFPRPAVRVVPNGTNVPAEMPHREGDGRTIIFCGLLSYEPNVDGVDFLVRDIFPEIRRMIPDARLMIVGRTPVPSVQAWHDGDAICVAADVSSVTDYYDRASVAVVPVRFGGGTRIKIPEAWAHGVPVVSTGIGCEGLESTHGESLLMADHPRDFAAHCVALLRSPDLRGRLRDAGWRLVSERYRWEAIGRGAVDTLRGLLAEDIGPAQRSEAVL